MIYASAVIGICVNSNYKRILRKDQEISREFYELDQDCCTADSPDSGHRICRRITSQRKAGHLYFHPYYAIEHDDGYVQWSIPKYYRWRVFRKDPDLISLSRQKPMRRKAIFSWAAALLPFTMLKACLLPKTPRIQKQFTPHICRRGWRSRPCSYMSALRMLIRRLLRN